MGETPTPASESEATPVRRKNPVRFITDPLRGRWPLWRAFWLAALPIGIVVLGLWIGLAPLDTPWVEHVLFGLTVVWAVWSSVAVWRCARHSRGFVRYPVQGIIGLFFGFWLLLLFLDPHYNDYETRAKIQEGVNLSNPARTALGIACSETDLLPGMSNYELGLVAPGEYNATHTHSVDAFVDEPDTGRVVVVFKAIGNDVEEGQTVVYHGVCDEAGMRWTITGSVPAGFRPKI